MKATQTAVVLIEFQNEFCKPQGKLYPLVEDELVRVGTIGNAAKLAEQAREKGCLVVHCPFVYDESWVQRHGVCGIIGGAAEKGAFRPDQWGTQLIDDIPVAEADEVLSGKHALSGFINTGLHEIFQSRGITDVVFAGFLSNVCVEGTARSAYDLGYRVQVIHDAVAAESQANQQYVEREIFPHLGGSTTVERFIEGLQ